MPVIFVELSPAIFPFAVMSPLNVPVVPDRAPVNVTATPVIFLVLTSLNVDTPATFKPLALILKPCLAVTIPAASTLVNVEIPVTFKSPLISPFPFKSNSVAVIIPVRLIEGTSNCPNNLPFNTKSPLIV